MNNYNRQKSLFSIILVLVLAVAGYIFVSHSRGIQNSLRFVSMISVNNSEFREKIYAPNTFSGESKSGESVNRNTAEVFSNGSHSVAPNFTFKSDQNSSRGKKYLMYLCDKYVQCYGFADRMRGIAALYVLSVLTNRQFGINMSHPWAFTDFYSPNEVQWDIPENELTGKSRKTITYIKAPLDELTKIDFNEVYPQDVVYIRTNAEILVHLSKNPNYKSKFPSWAVGRRATIIGNIWPKLVTPTVELRSGLNDELANIVRSMLNTSSIETNSSNAGAINGTLAPSLQPRMSLKQIRDLTDFAVADLGLVCVHVRIGHSKTLPFEIGVKTSEKSVSAVWNFLKAYVGKGHHVYLATDHNEIRTRGRALFGNRFHIIESPVVHVDEVMAGQDAKEGMKFALLEQLLLMTSCEVLVVSKSGYSMMASYVRTKLIGYKHNYMVWNGSVFKWSVW